MGAIGVMSASASGSPARSRNELEGTGASAAGVVVAAVPTVASRGIAASALASPGAWAPNVIWHLSGGRLHLTDPGNASRTLLFNLHTRRWDEDLLARFRIPPALLPRVVDSIGWREAGVIDGVIPPAALQPTLFSRLGNWLPLLLAAALLLTAIVLPSSRR